MTRDEAGEYLMNILLELSWIAIIRNMTAVEKFFNTSQNVMSCLVAARKLAVEHNLPKIEFKQLRNLVSAAQIKSFLQSSHRHRH